MNHFKFVIFPGILLFCQNGFSPLEIRANARFNVKEVDEVLNTINSFTPEQNRKYDEELIKRISAIKRLREKYRRSKMSEMNSDLLQRRRADYYRKMIKNDLWINDPYSKASYNSKRYGPYSYSRGKKDTYNPAASEFGVFKVKHKNYYMWAAHEKDYEDEGKAMGEVEVDDPLNCLSEDEKNEKLKLICQKEKYDEPFRDPKIIEFLKGVYYNFLARSKNTSASQPGISMHDNLKVRMDDFQYIGLYKFEENYFSNFVYLHVYIGILERTPPIDQDDVFPKYLPINMPKYILEFYYDKISLTKDSALCIFSESYDRSKVKFEDNPARIRINVLYCYELSTYGNFREIPNWNYKLSNVYNKSSSLYSYTINGRVVEKSAIMALFNETGCATHLSGIVVNPNAPYITYCSCGVTYCMGKTWMVDIKRPFFGRRNPLDVTLKNITYVYYDKNGKLRVKKKHKYYGQLQLGMAVMKLERAIFIIYNAFDNKVALLYLDFDKEFVRDMVGNLYRVYFSKLLPRIIQKSYTI